MRELINYAKGLNAKDNIITLIAALYNNQDIGEFEHIIDYLIHKNFDDLSWASYGLLKKKSQKWITQLSKNIGRIDEEEGIDFVTILDFEDGFRFVKLLSQEAYQREGALMSHCVATYYSRDDVEIFSLRDSFNSPHCTIEQDKQIKGKGNGDISPKYINYVVKFLEHKGMKVRESEMKHLGYKKVMFPEYCINKLFRGEYLRINIEVQYIDSVIIFNNINEAVKYKDDKICLFSGDVNFRSSNITELGQLQRIGGDADFGSSNITELGQLQSIGGDANFKDSNITEFKSVVICGNIYK